MTVPCVLLRFRDDVLPFALYSHLYTSFLRILTICTDRSSKPTAPLATLPPPRSRYGLYFTAATIRCEVKKISTSSFPHRPHPLRVLCLSPYTFWLWWSRVASMYDNCLCFQIIAMSTTFRGAFHRAVVWFRNLPRLMQKSRTLALCSRHGCTWQRY
jgi:hypothetical protein